MDSGLLAGWPIVFFDTQSVISARISACIFCGVIVKILISDTKCCIERNDFFVVLKAKVFSRELNRISGFVGIHIDL